MSEAGIRHYGETIWPVNDLRLVSTIRIMAGTSMLPGRYAFYSPTDEIGIMTSDDQQFLDLVR